MKLFKITWHKKLCPLVRIVFFFYVSKTLKRHRGVRIRPVLTYHMPMARVRKGEVPKTKILAQDHNKPPAGVVRGKLTRSAPGSARDPREREREGGRKILPNFPTRAVQRDIRRLTVGRMLLFSRDGASWHVTNMDAQRDTPWTGGEGPKFSDEKCCTSVWALFVLVALFFDLVRANHKCFRESCRK